MATLHRGFSRLEVGPGAAPQVLAAWHILARRRRRGVPNVAAGLCERGWQPHGTLPFLGLAQVATTE